MGHQMEHKKMNTTIVYKKSVSLLAALILLCTIGIGSTVAYIIDKTDELANIFIPAAVSCVVETNSAITNTGDTPAYIRAALVVNWKDKAGNVYGKKPVAGTDYSIEISDDWSKINGYYYWPNPVEKGRSTDILGVLNSGSVIAGYTLCLEIVAEAIQANPATAVEGAWDVTVNSDGTISAL